MGSEGRYCLTSTANEPVGKVLLTSENDVFGDHLTLSKYKIVDCGAFCEVIVFYISPKNLLGDFFYSLNAMLRGAAAFCRVPLQRIVIPYHFSSNILSWFPWSILLRNRPIEW